MKPIDFYGQFIDMAELTDNWTIVRSEAEFRLWKLTRAPMDEVKACVDLCFEERAAERKAAEKLVEVLTTQHCPVCGKGFSRELMKCPHCEKVAEEKELKARKKQKRAENYQRFVTTADKVVEVGNGFWRVVGAILNIVLFPIAIICMFLDACMRAQRRSERKHWPHTRHRRRY